MTAKELVTHAAKEIGVREEPVNRVKYNSAFYGREVSGAAYPWCCAFIWWVFKTLGHSEMFYGGGKTASCTELYRFHDARYETVHGDYVPGDVIFFDWDGSGDCDHVGICVSCTDGKIITIEGNTAVGNDSNGGEVMQRERSIKYVRGAYRPPYEREKRLLDEIISEITDAEAYELMQKAQRYAATLPAPEWAWDELTDAKADGITDGTAPMKLVTRAEAAIMAERAKAQ